MLQAVTITCGQCQHATEVIPRVTVSYQGGTIPTFDPPLCPECRGLLRPTPTEWAILLHALASGPEPVPNDWWDRYAMTNGPCPATILTA